MKEYSVFCKLKEEIDIELDSFEIRLMATDIVNATEKVEAIFKIEDLDYEAVEVQSIGDM